MLAKNGSAFIQTYLAGKHRYDMSTVLSYKGDCTVQYYLTASLVKQFLRFLYTLNICCLPLYFVYLFNIFKSCMYIFLLINFCLLQVTIDCTKIQSITREKTAYVVPNAILICTDEEKVSFTKFCGGLCHWLCCGSNFSLV